MWKFRLTKCSIAKIILRMKNWTWTSFNFFNKCDRENRQQQQRRISKESHLRLSLRDQEHQQTDRELIHLLLAKRPNKISRIHSKILLHFKASHVSKNLVYLDETKCLETEISSQNITVGIFSLKWIIILTRISSLIRKKCKTFNGFHGYWEYTLFFWLESSF